MNSVEPQQAGDVIKVSNGQQIIREQDGVSVGERKFVNLKQAET